MAIALFHELMPTEEKWERTADVPKNSVGFIFDFAVLGQATWSQVDSQLTYRRCYIYDGRTICEPQQWGKPQPESLLFLQWQPNHLIAQDSTKTYLEIKSVRTQRAKPIVQWYTRCFYIEP